ncbi:MAG: IS66 family insertion sequence element accessory protein TnpB [Alicyclobacillus macrosporangiidus]|uniref:IS66 family insertion sequence element accessory protein TnpB n=1 Tax=Alicyclobacillus macrosporangiidus TaxID=392015 RepID=UPI0026E98545|nr:IS66 family insertion sequence element accessory protein TnpB [Alicyclobacillus macrosporangiidus]MCL6599802.1 IS66 family insertion sequence element accessory protein TnpB [Alicyclobacillus macrosporangiidus]
MLNEAVPEQRVYLACGATDMRKSIDGLAALVQERFNLNPFSPCLFVFCNRQRDKLKILQWDHNSFWVHYRRLERGRFQWPSASSGETVVVSRRQLRWLLDGLSITQRQAHTRVSAHTVV